MTLRAVNQPPSVGDKCELASPYGCLLVQKALGNRREKKIANGHQGKVTGFTPDGFALVAFEHDDAAKVPIHWLHRMAD